MEKRLKKKRILLLDMYGVIIKESKGYFIPYTFDHFDDKEHERLKIMFYEEQLFTKASNGELSSDEFLSMLGYSNPSEAMKDYLTNYLTLDKDFFQFAENNYKHYNFVLISNDVKEWSAYLFELYGLNKYFQQIIVSGNIHMRKPESHIFLYTVNSMQCTPQECIFVDNSVINLNSAQKTGIDVILFNRDNEAFWGNIVNNFQELDKLLNNF